MSFDEDHANRVFTVEEANRTLPLVRAIVADLAKLSSQVVERRQRVSQLLAGREPESGDPYADELAAVQRQVEHDSSRLEEYTSELKELGVIARNGPEGLVDFPAVLDGRPAFLCWKLGESEVLFWHDLNDGYIDRLPLTADSVSDSVSDSTGGDNSFEV